MPGWDGRWHPATGGISWRKYVTHSTVKLPDWIKEKNRIPIVQSRAGRAVRRSIARASAILSPRMYDAIS
jgi:hypothetical protein